MKFKNRLKRVADALEKLGVAGIAIGLFQNNYSGIGVALAFIMASILMTRED